MIGGLISVVGIIEGLRLSNYEDLKESRSKLKFKWA